MNHRERFVNIFKKQSVDRIPCYFFGMWPETKQLWINAGHNIDDNKKNAGPTLHGMDPDWEEGMWECHKITELRPIGDGREEILEKGQGFVKIKDSLGAVHIHRTDGASVSHTEKFVLEPTKESWNNFKKTWAPDDKKRLAGDYKQKIIELNEKNHVRAFVGGSFYGWLREYMGVLNLSYLMYDNPTLMEEMISHICDVCMTVMKPVLDKTNFELVYIFEDCCGSNGPLFSPDIANKIFKPYYKKLLDFYKANGVSLALVDSDGIPDLLVPMWLESGFDIIFPVEVGKWGGSVKKLREKYGVDLNAMGGVDKYIIAKGRKEIRKHLQELAPQVEAGGYLPIPDHRIPPEVSYENMREYIDEFHKLFG